MKASFFLLESLLEIAANIVLFISSLILLINIAPKDFSPKYRNLTNAVSILRDNENVYGPIPAGVSINYDGEKRPIQNASVYKTLFDLITNKSLLAKNANLSRAIGVGYSKISAPVATNSIVAYRPLYIVLYPQGSEDVLELLPVGTLEDLDRWASEPRQQSLNFWALLLLTIGFFMQILPSFIGLLLKIKSIL